MLRSEGVPRGDGFPPGWRLRHTLRGHTVKINRIAWTPDGSRLVSSADDGTVRVWDPQTGLCDHVLPHSEGGPAAAQRSYVAAFVFDVAVSPDGNRVLSGSQASVKIWDIQTGALLKQLPRLGPLVVPLPDGRRLLTCSGQDVCVVSLDAEDPHAAMLFLQAHEGGYGPFATITPDGTRAIVQRSGAAVAIYDTATGRFVSTLEVPNAPEASPSSPGSEIRSLAVSPDGQRLAAGSADHLVYLWDLSSGAFERMVSAHAAQVSGVDFSSDGRLLVTKGWMERILLWDVERAELLSQLDESLGSTYVGATPRFHPKQADVLATFGEEQLAIRVWSLSVPMILGQVGRSVSTATARIALVGDSGVGKSGLALRIVTGEFVPTDSTHGEQFWVVDHLAGRRQDDATCEAVLWDFAGQPDYRLVHALFLDDIDLALVLFDATNQDEPLSGVDYWLDHMGSARRQPSLMLVGARADRGAPALSERELADFCAERQITGGYLETSARTGLGIDELIGRVRGAVAWNALPPTTTTPAIQTIRDHITRAKEQAQQRPLASWGQLRGLLEEDGLSGVGDPELRSAVASLQQHGYVTLLRGSGEESFVLLAPDMLINLASSIVLEARRNPDSLGALDEDQLRHGGYALAELAGLDDRDRTILLDAALALFLQRALCFRERLGPRALLIFPSLVRSGRVNPMNTVALEEDVTYRLTGAVQNVYAALVVLLGYTNTFSRSEHWRDEARYESDGHICGFRLLVHDKQEIELVLEYSAEAPDHTRRLFQGLFETFVARTNASVKTYPPAVCQVCRTRQQRGAVVARIDDRYDFIHCGGCGNKIALTTETRPLTLVEGDRAALSRESDVSRRRTAFEEVLVRFKRETERLGPLKPSCFLSYAWGDPAQEQWVEQLAKDLENAGVEVLLDRWQSAAIGSNVADFVNRIASADYVIVVGTPAYLQRRAADAGNDAERYGRIADAEARLIDYRLTRGTPKQRSSVLPVLLEDEPVAAFSPLLLPLVPADFRNVAAYFDQLLEVLLTLFGIANEAAGRTLREEMRLAQGGKAVEAA